MRAIYVVHIVAGSLSLISGYVALFAGKGAKLHRSSGMLFVYAIEEHTGKKSHQHQSLPGSPRSSFTRLRLVTSDHLIGRRG